MTSQIEFLNHLQGEVERALDRRAGVSMTGGDRPGPGPAKLPRRWGFAAVAAGLVVASIAGGVTAYQTSQPSGSDGSHPPPRSNSGGGGFLGFPMPAIGKDPFAIGGHPVSLATAKQTAGYPWPVPNAPAANLTLLRYVWTGWYGEWTSLAHNGQGGVAREVVLEYPKTGVRVLINPIVPRFPRHAIHAWREMVPELNKYGQGSHATAEFIDGVAALVTSGRGASAAWPRGGYSTVIELAYPSRWIRLDITIIGSRWISGKQVYQIAESLARQAHLAG